MKHGYGKWWKSADNPTNTYEGHYFENKKQGQGVYVWASGNKYEGEYQDDERDGIGTMMWIDGNGCSVYIGEWWKGI